MGIRGKEKNEMRSSETRAALLWLLITVVSVCQAGSPLIWATKGKINKEYVNNTVVHNRRLQFTHSKKQNNLIDIMDCIYLLHNYTTIPTTLSGNVIQKNFFNFVKIWCKSTEFFCQIVFITLHIQYWVIISRISFPETESYNSKH